MKMETEKSTKTSFYSWIIDEAAAHRLFEKKDDALKETQRSCEFFEPPNYGRPTAAIHCTARFIAARSAVESSQSAAYQLDPLVESELDRETHLSVIGFLFTSKVALARVKLSDGVQMKLFENFVQLKRPHSVEQFFSIDNQIELGQNQEDLYHVSYQQYGSVDNGDKWQRCPFESRFHPTCGLSATAHITLGLADGISSKVAGSELWQLVELEGALAKEPSDFYPTFLADVKSGGLDFLRAFGTKFLCVYLEKPLELKAFFRLTKS